MARTFAELAIVVTVASITACGGGTDSSVDGGEGTADDTGSDGTGADDGDGDGDGDSADDADSTGTPVGCGDGVIDEGETCDDGPDNGTYGHCTATCDAVTSCGDAEVQRDGGEACDDGRANGTYGHCAADCSAMGPRCGDGIVDAQKEECDDGNEVTGDGCNVGCELGGQLLMSRVFDTGDFSRAYAVDVLPDGRYYVAGLHTTANQAYFAAFDSDDGGPFHTSIGPHDGGTYRTASTLDASRVLAVGHTLEPDAVGLRVWIDLDAGTETAEHIDDAAFGLSGTALPGGGHVLCNTTSGVGLAYFVSTNPLAPQWEHTVDDCNAVAADANVVVSAWTEVLPGEQWPLHIRAYTHAGLTAWGTEFYLGVGSTSATAVAIDSASNVVLTGVFQAEAGQFRPYLRKYDDQGELAWAANALLVTRSSWNGVAIDANDNVVVCGSHEIEVELDGATVQLARPIVRKYSSEGDLIWSWQDDAWDETDVWDGMLEDVAVAPDGTILAAGWRGTYATDDDSIAIVRISP